ncbi:heavy-metal-associated domain-containing protein [Pseudoduganella chitinolytica]|uniref:Cation transporter n=1 Tax=Pseudoduganella chitinolytica TaxID=34070 RepID=A0ABY8BBZ7_9BURK|nr:cation transporter [Pseudoduganella chitinolytica]WEF33425.1 cation transporter [Pseudoduganella chitinolytica]
MYELQVENMSCGHCVASVTKAVQAVDGAARVDVDLAGKQVKVASSAPLDAVKAAIAEAGYPVTAAR